MRVYDGWNWSDQPCRASSAAISSMRSATMSTGPSTAFARKYRNGRSRLRASSTRSPFCATRANDPSRARTSPTSLASNLRRASDSSTVQSRWDSGAMRLMTREIGSGWFIEGNWVSRGRFSRSRAVASSLLVLVLAGCKEGGGHPLFKLLSPDETGVSFANTITTSDSLNVQTDVYIYNGAGVAVGDVNNDGLPDIFFSGNMVSSRLYRNKGHMQFDDVTDRAGVKTNRWATGVTMVDINDDGWLDIYVCVSGPRSSKPEDRANLLFINNRDGTFTESAAKYGIAETGFTTQAAWLDYDGDGDLDLFLLDNSPEDFTRGDVTSHPGGVATTPGSFNQLYRNNGDGTFR